MKEKKGCYDFSGKKVCNVCSTDNEGKDNCELELEEEV